MTDNIVCIYRIETILQLSVHFLTVQWSGVVFREGNAFHPAGQRVVLGILWTIRKDFP